MKKIIIFLILLLPINVKAISASSYIIMDSDNNRVLEGNNIYRESLIASITKIMTSMVVINNSNIHREITINDDVLKSYGSGIYIKPGENISILNLLYGLMLRSGNDAAIALASYVGGSMEEFSKMMNELALSLGMKNTNFINSNGLEEGEAANKSTVYDMALLSSYAIHNEVYRKVVGTKNIKVKTNMNYYDWTNKNKLLHSYEYCIGGKTGFTEKAKRTLVTNASKNDINLTVVTINDGNDFDDHKDLYEKYFSVLKNYNLVTKGKIKTKYDNTYIDSSFNMSLTDEEYKNLNKEIIYYDESASNIIGQLIISYNGKKYYKGDIHKEEIKQVKLTFWDKLKKKISELW